MCQHPQDEHAQVFFILADLNWEAEDPNADPEHRLLLCAQAFKDGTIQLQPPVHTRQQHESQLGTHGGWRKLHDRQGGLYEYKISIRASGGGDDSISERKQQLWEEHERQHAARAHRGMLGKFLRPRGSRLAVLGEILAAGGFEGARLYVEFALRFPSDLWVLKGPQWLLEQHAALEGQFDEEGVCHVRTALHWGCRFPRGGAVGGAPTCMDTDRAVYMGAWVCRWLAARSCVVGGGCRAASQTRRRDRSWPTCATRSSLSWS